MGLKPSVGIHAGPSSALARNFSLGAHRSALQNPNPRALALSSPNFPAAAQSPQPKSHPRALGALPKLVRALDSSPESSPAPLLSQISQAAKLLLSQIFTVA